MPSPLFVWFEGAKQGKIEGWNSWPGEDNIKGTEGSSIVYSLEHRVHNPVDPATGLTTGRRQHDPVSLLKRKDKATPKLLQALVQNENLQVQFKWFRPNTRGAGQVHYYTVKLSDARLVSIKEMLPSTIGEEAKQWHPLEEVQMTYNKIEWTWEDGGITSMDDWTEMV